MGKNRIITKKKEDREKPSEREINLKEEVKNLPDRKGPGLRNIDRRSLAEEALKYEMNGEFKFSIENDLYKILEQDYADFEFNMPDLVFGRFYMLNGEIVGYMDTKELKPGQLYLDSTYIEENEKTKYALPAMIASLMMALEALMGDEATISMQILNPHLLKGVRAMYGYAPVELDVLEMFKQI